MHESNTFAAARTDVAAFEAGGLETGAGIVARWGEAHHEVGGFFEAAQRVRLRGRPDADGRGRRPPGRSTADDLSRADRPAPRGDPRRRGRSTRSSWRSTARWSPTARPTPTARTLARVRDLIGPDRPLVVSLDYHANVSPLMASASDALVAYRTYPHVDQRARGLRAAGLARAGGDAARSGRPRRSASRRS